MEEAQCDSRPNKRASRAAARGAGSRNNQQMEEVSHSEEDRDVSQSSASRDEQDKPHKPQKSRTKSLDCSCKPKNIIEAASFLSEDERRDVTRLGFGAFLKLKLETNCSPKAVKWLMEVSDLLSHYIAMHVKADRTLNLTADVIHKLLRVPFGGTTKLPKIDSRVEFDRLKEQLGIEGGLDIKVLLLKLEKSRDGSLDRELRLRIFFMILISNYLIPTQHKLASTEAVIYTCDVTKIGQFDWCTIIYKHLREVIQTVKSGDLSERYLPGCCPVLLVYFLEHIQSGLPDIVEDKGESADENEEETARVNLYDKKRVNSLLRKARRRTNGKEVFDGFQWKTRGQSCYGESSTTQISSQMSSVESQPVSALVHSEGLRAVARMGLGLSQPTLETLQGLILELKPYAPSSLQDKATVATMPSVEDLYNQLVVAKIGSSDESKIDLDINDMTMTEHDFVESLRPEGYMHSAALDAECSVWNACPEDRIVLLQDMSW